MLASPLFRGGIGLVHHNVDIACLLFRNIYTSLKFSLNTYLHKTQCVCMISQKMTSNVDVLNAQFFLVYDLLEERLFTGVHVCTPIIAVSFSWKGRDKTCVHKSCKSLWNLFTFFKVAEKTAIYFSGMSTPLSTPRALPDSHFRQVQLNILFLHITKPNGNELGCSFFKMQNKFKRCLLM